VVQNDDENKPRVAVKGVGNIVDLPNLVQLGEKDLQAEFFLKPAKLDLKYWTLLVEAYVECSLPDIDLELN
jgi:hypothetical protein